MALSRMRHCMTLVELTLICPVVSISSLTTLVRFAMETIVLPHLPDYPVHAALFKDVANAPYLRQQLLAGNAEYEYAFLDAAMLVSRSHVFAACLRAINDKLHNRLKSKNVHSEIVFSLSPNNNVGMS
jgi:EKC/KEOPS complex subunit CGI121/TPRKB